MSTLLAVLSSIIAAVIQSLAPILEQRAAKRGRAVDVEPTTEDTERAARMRERRRFPAVGIKPVPTGNPAAPLFPFLVLATGVMLFGCAPDRKVFFVPPGVPVRLGEEVRGVRVYVRDAETGNIVPATATLRPGMWIDVDPAEWPDAARAAEMDLTPSAK